jgi:hypothetical protein
MSTPSHIRCGRLAVFRRLGPLLALLACSGPDPVSGPAPVRLALTVPPPALVENGVPFSPQPVVQLRDAADRDVRRSGVSVTASVMVGDGVLSGTTTVETNDGGQAVFTDLVLVGAGRQQVLVFNAPDLAPVTSAEIELASGPATQVVLTTEPPGTTQSGATFTRQPVVQLRDAAGNDALVSGVPVTARIATGGGTLSGTNPVQTDQTGKAVFTDLALTGTPGARRLEFSTQGLAPDTSAMVNVASGSPDGLALTTQPSGSAPSGEAFSRQPVVQLRDAAGNALRRSGVPVSAAIATGGGTLFGSNPAHTNVDGEARFTTLAISGSAGSRTLAFNAPGYTPTVSDAINLTPGAGVQLVLTTPPSATAQSGVPFGQQPVVQLRDAAGNDIAQSGVPVTAAIAAGGGTLGGINPVQTNASGQAIFTNLDLTGPPGDRTLEFTAPGLNPTTSGPIALTSGVAATLVILTQPSATAQSGVSFTQQPVLQLRDGAGNDVAQAGVPVTAAIAAGGGTLSGVNPVQTDGSGRATFTDLTITGTPGDRTLEFSAPSVTPITSATISLTSGAASQLGLTTQPSANAQSGVPFPEQPVVQLRDGAGNNVAQSGVSVTAAIASGGGTLSGTNPIATDGAGQAAFTDLAITGSAGNRTLQFTAPGVSGVFSGNIMVAACTDAYEPNESIGAAAAITPGGPSISARICTGTDNDYYSLIADSGQTVTLSLTGPAENFDLYLYDPSQAQVGASTGPSSTESITYAAVADGTHYIRVVGAGGAFNETTA